MFHFAVFNVILECKIPHTSDKVAYVLLEGRECVPHHEHAFCQVVNVPYLYLSLHFRWHLENWREKCNGIAAVNYSFLACIQLLNIHFFKISEFRCLYCSLWHMVLRRVSFGTFENQSQGAA